MIRHGPDSFIVTSADEPKTDPRHAERQCGVKTPAKRTQNHIWSVTKPTEAFSCPTEPDTENRLSWCLASGTLMQRRLRFASHQVVIATHDGAKKIYIIYFQRHRGVARIGQLRWSKRKLRKLPSAESLIVIWGGGGDDGHRVRA